MLVLHSYHQLHVRNYLETKIRFGSGFESTVHHGKESVATFMAFVVSGAGCWDSLRLGGHGSRVFESVTRLNHKVAL